MDHIKFINFIFYSSLVAIFLTWRFILRVVIKNAVLAIDLVIEVLLKRFKF